MILEDGQKRILAGLHSSADRQVNYQWEHMGVANGEHLRHYLYEAKLAKVRRGEKASEYGRPQWDPCCGGSPCIDIVPAL